MSDPQAPESEPPESERPKSESAQPRLGGPLALAAVTLGLITWPIAFNLGAYGEIFYENVFQVVVAASILFVIVIVNDVYEAPRSWIVRGALAAPLLWLLAAAYVTGSTTEALDRPVFVVALVLIGVVSVPLTLRLLVDMSMPELTHSNSVKVTTSIVGLVVAIGLIGFLVGRDHPRFLKCEDFSVAGASEPDDCAR